MRRQLSVLRRARRDLPRAGCPRRARAGLRGLLQPVAGHGHVGRGRPVRPGCARRRVGLRLGMIRIAGRSDLPAIVGIYNEAVADRFATADLDPITEEGRAGWFESHDARSYPIYVAGAGGHFVGWASLTAYRGGRAAVRRTAEISYYVARAARRQGIGRALVEHALLEAPGLGLHVLFGIILERNAGSIRLMERCGFALWGRLRDVAEIDGTLVAHVYYGRSL